MSNDSNEELLPSLNDYVSWIEHIVIRYGVEIDIFAWEEIKKNINKDNICTK